MCACGRGGRDEPSAEGTNRETDWRASRIVIKLPETTYQGAAVTVANLREALLNMGFLPLEERGRVLVLDGPEKVRESRG